MGLIAMIILNCSVDAPDLQPEYVPEDLTYNDIESIVEWVLEDVLGYQDIIKEYDDDDNSNIAIVKKVIEPFLPTPTFPEYEPLPSKAEHFTSETLLACAEDRFFNQFISEPPSPPPWAGA